MMVTARNDDSSGRIAIEFTRTRGWEARDRDDDELDSWERYVHWALREGVVNGGAVSGLLKEGKRRSQAASRAVMRARRLRDSVYGLLVARAEKQRALSEDLERLNEELKASGAWLQLVQRGSAHSWGWKDNARFQLGFITWSVARSIADLLTGESAERIRLCASHDCGWLFLDESRNRTRRWCSMKGCGNVEKARRFRSRD
jgi:predicted RNA-binding Zn ribbon-like protein